MAEYAFIKLLTAASVHERGRLEWDDVTNIVYSFHSRSQHSSEVAANFHRHIETVRTGDDLSMIHLLTLVLFGVGFCASRLSYLADFILLFEPLKRRYRLHK